MRRRCNPITPRRGTGTLWRSVSPDELKDILRTGLITGRGGAFSGDTRGMVFFGIQGEDDVLHNGEDTLRQVESRPEWVARFRKLDPAYAELASLRTRIQSYEGTHLAFWPRNAQALHERLVRLERQTDAKHKKLLDRLYRETREVRAFYRKHVGATSFILVLRGVRGGTLYTRDDSFHVSDEVGFRRPVSAQHIVRIYRVLEREILESLTTEEVAHALRALP